MVKGRFRGGSRCLGFGSSVAPKEEWWLATDLPLRCFVVVLFAVAEL